MSINSQWQKLNRYLLHMDTLKNTGIVLHVSFFRNINCTNAKVVKQKNNKYESFEATIVNGSNVQTCKKTASSGEDDGKQNFIAPIWASV